MTAKRFIVEIEGVENVTADTVQMVLWQFYDGQVNVWEVGFNQMLPPKMSALPRRHIW